jgi:hypothetical protein
MGEEDVEMKDALPPDSDTGWGPIVHVDRPEFRPWQPMSGITIAQGEDGGTRTVHGYWQPRDEQMPETPTIDVRDLPPDHKRRWRDNDEGGEEEEDGTMDVVVDAPRPDAAAMEDAAIRVVEGGEWSRDRMNAEWGAFLDEVADDLQADHRYYFRCNRDVLKSAYATLITQGGSIDDVSNVGKALLQGMATYFANERDYGEQHEKKHRPFAEPKALNEAFAALPQGQRDQLLAADVAADPIRSAVVGMLYMSGTHTIHVDEERFALHPVLRQAYGGAIAFTWRAPRQDWDERIRGFLVTFCTKTTRDIHGQAVLEMGKPVLDWMMAHTAYAVLALDDTAMIQVAPFPIHTS